VLRVPVFMKRYLSSCISLFATLIIVAAGNLWLFLGKGVHDQ